MSKCPKCSHWMREVCDECDVDGNTKHLLRRVSQLEEELQNAKDNVANALYAARRKELNDE